MSPGVRVINVSVSSSSPFLFSRYRRTCRRRFTEERRFSGRYLRASDGEHLRRGKTRDFNYFAVVRGRHISTAIAAAVAAELCVVKAGFGGTVGVELVYVAIFMALRGA